MRIGIDIRLWNESGVGRYIRNLVKQLQLIDKENEYVLFGLSKYKSEILKPFGLAQGGQVRDDNFKIAEADIRWHTVSEQLKFPAILNKENLDLVHFPYFSVPIFYNKPFVVTIHDLIIHHFPTGEASTLPSPFYKLKLLGYKFVIQQAAKKASKIITVSNATKSEILDHFGVMDEKVVVTHEGFDSSKLQFNPSTSLRARIKNYFLYVGNAYPHKNLERMLEAFARIKNKELGIKLVLVGKEDYFYKRLKDKVKRLGLEESVIFYGEATDKELSMLYKNAKALVMPSLMEGFGLPALEAMANGCLVLASDIPSLKEVCGDSAVYFDPKNVNDIVKKMEAVHYNDIYHYSGNIKKGLERAKAFSWKKMAEETLKVYQEVFSKKNG